MTSVMIAMSGGVDSSVAAYLLQQQGYRCAGATMRLLSEGARSNCCSPEDAEDAKSVCERLGIPHYVFDFSKEFERDVVDKFAEEYRGGRTPNPCIECNRHLKFGGLLRLANELGYEYIATGHYARTEDGRLFAAKDSAKDQSYALYCLTREQLARTLFPLGGMTKSETRRVAENCGFVNARKKESQDICFVPDGDYAAFIERQSGAKAAPGDFLDTSGRVIGRHGGLIRYTVGQRRGLGVSAEAPLYVKEKRASDNTIVLGNASEVRENMLIANNFNWIAETPATPLRVTARTRYHQPPHAATAEVLGGDVRVVFDEPQKPFAPGQAAVLYNGEEVLGGGVIGVARLP
ncbi:tRNA-specific 2-thiouridylase MnmA [Clostridia bacterium]|nr:tRNA-specific 2-thiouridylase MnmA [Clostridia bacterium]